jgi:protein-S-isoprenylcysteine O-methyltransferase Ste14
MQKLLPPFLLLISISVMTALHFVVPYQSVIYPPFNYLGIALIISGLIITIKVGRTFSKVGTEINTFKKPRQLVTSGLFQYSRNPIYVGYVISLIGVNIILGSLTPIIVVLLFIFITDYWYIPFEERNMQNQFGQAYEDYKKKVRRWM